MSQSHSTMSVGFGRGRAFPGPTPQDRVYSCSRCNRTYGSHSALQQHLENSPQHHRCAGCGFDSRTWTELVSHVKKMGHGVVCQGCNDGNGRLWPLGSKAYDNHLYLDHVCPHCQIHLRNENDLRYHMNKHREPTYECFTCESKYKNYTGMILHVESGTCPGGLKFHALYETVAKFPEWSQFLYLNYRAGLLRHSYSLHELNRLNPFWCPTCRQDFCRLSALFMHVASDSCKENRRGGVMARLVAHLKRTHDRTGSKASRSSMAAITDQSLI